MNANGLTYTVLIYILALFICIWLVYFLVISPKRRIAILITTCVKVGNNPAERLKMYLERKKMWTKHNIDIITLKIDCHLKTQMYLCRPK